MKRRKLIASLLLLCLLFPAFAVFASEPPESSVYASEDVQEYVYNCTQVEASNAYRTLQRYHIRLLKETITPEYILDLLDYAANDTFELKPSLNALYTDNPQVYYAKTVTENNEFAGNVELCVENGETHFLCYNHTTAVRDDFLDSPYQASCSYADHARRIADALGSEELIPPEDVTFVIISGFHRQGPGACFCVRKDGETYFIPVGRENVKPEYAYGEVDLVITQSELKEMALEHEKANNEHLKYIEEYRKEHPESNWIPVGDGSAALEITSFCSSVDNIIDVKGFFAEAAGPAEKETAEPTAAAETAAPPAQDTQTAAGETASPIEQKTEPAANTGGRALYWLLPAAVLLAAAAWLLLRSRGKKK